VKTARAALELERRNAIAQNLRAQIAILEEQGDHASALGVQLDQLLTEAEQALQAADAAVAQSIEDLNSLVQIALDQDPDAAALGWLNDHGIAGIVQNATPGAAAGEVDDAAQQLLSQLQSAA
jgi:hypothetical protein